MFAERGIEASVPDVAERAGVGKATVYRSFPTKEHLIAAVVTDHLAEFERRARAKLDEPDAWAALEELMADAAAKQCGDRTLSGALKAGVAPELLPRRARACGPPSRLLMDRAKAQGAMRPDATPGGPARALARRRARARGRRGRRRRPSGAATPALALGALRA